MYNLELDTAPAIEPLSLTEIKDYLKISPTTEVTDVTTSQSLVPLSRAVNTYTGTSIEILGYIISIVLNVGTVVGSLVVKVQDSNNGTDWTDVSTFAAVTSSNDNAVYKYDYTGIKRYIRGYATVTTDVATFSVDVNINLGDTTEDAYLNALITTARKYCEGYQNRAYITQTWEMSFDYWFDNDVIAIPKGNLQSITSIIYKDYAGTNTTISATDYVVSTRGVLGCVCPAYNKSWVTFTAYPLDAIVIKFVCGYGATASTVPETVKQAMYLLISHWYENRLPLGDKMSTTSEIDFCISSLLSQERIVIL